MAEQILTGIGRPEKPSLKSWVKKTFTSQGNEAAWRKKHTKEIEEIKSINASLSDEDRSKATEKIEQHIKNSAKLRVVGNYVAATVATAAVVGEGALLLFPGLAEKAEQFTIKGKHVLKPFGWSARMARTGMSEVGKSVERMFRRKPAGGVTQEESNQPNVKPEKNVNVDLAALHTLGDFIGDNQIAQKAEHIFEAIAKKMQPLNKKYNVGDLFPDGIPTSFSLPGFEKPMVQELAREMINAAHSHGDQWQELIFGIESNGSYSLLKDESKIGTFGWVGAIQEMLEKGVLEKRDFHEDAFAVFINDKFGDLLRNVLKR